MSLKHLAKSTILGQTTDFKVNVVATKDKSEVDRIQVVVDEIWNTFDVDNSGVLDKHEIK